MINKISNVQFAQNKNLKTQNKHKPAFGMSIEIDYKHMRRGSIKSIFKTIKTFLKAKNRINIETKEVEINIGQAHKSEIYLLGIPKKFNETKYNLGMSDFDNQDATPDFLKSIKMNELTPEKLYDTAIEVYKATKSRFFI